MIEELYKQVGQLKVELDWLKKNLISLSDKDRIQTIEPLHPRLSIVKQCELLGVNRASFYYQPRSVSEFDLMLMNKIDKIYTEFFYYGYRKITAQLRQKDISVNRKKIARLMRIMDLKAIVPKKPK